MIQTIKTLLAVFTIVTTVGFVAANSVTPQASAAPYTVGNSDQFGKNLINPAKPPGTGPCVSNNAPDSVPP